MSVASSNAWGTNVSSHRKATGKASRTASIPISSGDFLDICLLPRYSIKRITGTPTFPSPISQVSLWTSHRTDGWRQPCQQHCLTLARHACHHTSWWQEELAVTLQSQFRLEASGLPGKEAVLSPEWGENVLGKHNTPDFSAENRDRPQKTAASCEIMENLSWENSQKMVPNGSKKAPANWKSHPQNHRISHERWPRILYSEHFCWSPWYRIWTKVSTDKTNVEHILLQHFSTKIILRITSLGQQYVKIISMFDV